MLYTYSKYFWACINKKRYTEGSVPSVENINPVYAMVFFWPTNENQVVKLFSPIAGPKTNVTFLGYSGSGEIKVYYITFSYAK